MSAFTRAEIFFQGGMAPNGTFLDGTRVTECSLAYGQGIRIGSVGLIYLSATQAQQQTTVRDRARKASSYDSAPTSRDLSNASAGQGLLGRNLGGAR
jgi:hypothetical protein